jgi:phosphate transport system substrate-binding protein
MGLLAVITALLLAGCAREAQGPGAARQVTLTGAGATFPYPLYSKWFDEYAKAAPEVRINYQSIGSGGGIQQLKARTVDFGASDAPLSDEEAKAMPASVVHIPTAAGAVALAYNLPGAPRPLRLDPAVIAGIYLGQITKWNNSRISAANPGARLPSAAIAVVHRSDGSGTTHIFTHYLAAVSKPWAERVGAGKSVQWPVGIGAKGNEGVTGVIKQTFGGIGYVELAYAAQNRLPCAEVRNARGEFVAPSIASTTVAAGGAADRISNDVRAGIVNSPAKGAYPIAGFTYILVYRDQADRAKGEALARFLHWAIHDGQRLAAPLEYAPLPPQVVALNERALLGLTAKGKPLSAGATR